MTSERVRVLIVDDDETFLDDLRRLMSGRYETAIAHNALEAESAHEKLPLDAVLLDIDLGRGVDGFEILEKFHESDPGLPVIMVTRDSSAASATSALKKGAVDYIDKRPDLEDLERRISRAIEEQRVARLNEALRRQIDELHGEMVGEGAKMRELRREIALAAESESPVLIVGETGTGKELVAREIHRLFRPGAPFIAFNCAAVPHNTFEHKVFGSIRGGFTEARDTAGVFELAHDGVLLLDEITEVDSSLQAVLLRVIQEREFERIGESRKMPFRGKLLVSTNRPLQKSLDDGTLRDDLYYRFGAHVINVPPLRDRREDIPALVHHFIARKAVELKRPERPMDETMMTELCRRDWPGNVRELEHVIEAYILRGTLAGPALPGGDSGSALSREDLYRMTYRDAKDIVLKEFQRKYTDAVLAACGGDEVEAARRVGLSPWGFRKMRLELEKPDSPKPRRAPSKGEPT